MRAGAGAPTMPPACSTFANVPPARPRIPPSAFDSGPRMKRRAPSLARSAMSDVTRSRTFSLPVFTNSPTAFSALWKAPTRLWPMSPTDLARLAGVVAERGRDRLPTGDGGLGRGLGSSRSRGRGGASIRRGVPASSSAVSKRSAACVASVSASEPTSSPPRMASRSACIAGPTPSKAEARVAAACWR